MEPMALGSPVGSPVSPISSTSPFLPSFLMGDQNSGGPRAQQPSTIGSRSPSRLSRQVSLPTPTQPTPQERSLMHTPAGEKTGGPPTRGLFDTFDTYLSPQPSPLARPQPPAVQTVECLSPYPEPSSSSRHHWVTVFGFPPSSASQILLQFSRYGNVLETRPARGGGNWAHLRYGSVGEARRALSKNAKVFGAGIMVGVVPCTDEEVIGSDRDRGKENVSSSGQSDASFASPCGYLNTPTMGGAVPRSLGTPLGYTTASPLNTSYRATPPRPRLVGAAYANAKHATEVQMVRHTPQRSAGLVNKAWEFLGW